jgi:hypothetical protein
VNLRLYLVSRKSLFLGSCFPDSKYLCGIRALIVKYRLFRRGRRNQHASRVRSRIREIRVTRGFTHQVGV